MNGIQQVLDVAFNNIKEPVSRAIISSPDNTMESCGADSVDTFIIACNVCDAIAERYDVNRMKVVLLESSTDGVRQEIALLGMSLNEIVERIGQVDEYVRRHQADFL